MRFPRREVTIVQQATSPGERHVKEKQKAVAFSKDQSEIAGPLQERIMASTESD